MFGGGGAGSFITRPGPGAGGRYTQLASAARASDGGLAGRSGPGGPPSPSDPSGGGACCHGIEELCFEPTGRIASTEWTYVGRGKGSYEPTEAYSYVGEGAGSFMKEEVAPPPRLRCRPACLCLLPALLALGACLAVLWLRSRGLLAIGGPEPWPALQPGAAGAAAATTTPYAGRCSDVGANCNVTRCCNDVGLDCYLKDEFWATCRARCAPGVDTLEDHDPEFQTPWSCAVLGGDRSSGPAAGGSPWPAEDAANDAIGAADETVSHQEAAGSSADESAGAEDDVHGEVGDALEIADGMHLVVGDSDGAAGDPIVRGFDDAADEAKASDEHSDRTGVRASGSVGSAGSVKKGVSTSVLGTPGQHGQSGHGPPGQNWPPQPTAQKHRSRNSTEENSSGSVVVPSKHPVRRMQDSLAEGLQNAHAGALHHTGRAADAAQDLHESAREHAQKAGGAVVDTVQGLHSGAMEHAGKVTGTLVGTALDVHGGLKSSVERAAEQLAGAASRDNAAALKRLGHVADAAEDVHDAAKSHADRTANALVGAMQAVAGSLSALAGALAPSFGIQTDETRQRAQEAKDAAYGGRDGDTHGGRWKVAGGRWAYVKAGAAED